MPEDLTYFTFGRTREEQVATAHRMIDCAAVLNPAYGVIQKFLKLIYRLPPTGGETKEMKRAGGAAGPLRVNMFGAC